MNGIFDLDEWLIFVVNVGKSTIHEGCSEFFHVENVNFTKNNFSFAKL